MSPFNSIHNHVSTPSSLPSLPTGPLPPKHTLLNFFLFPSPSPSSNRLLLRCLMFPQLLRHATNTALHKHLFQIVHHILSLIAQERNRHAALARTTRPTDSVRVALDARRHVKVDHQ